MAVLGRYSMITLAWESIYHNPPKPLYRNGLQKQKIRPIPQSHSYRQEHYRKQSLYNIKIMTQLPEYENIANNTARVYTRVEAYQ